jgi:hypothetical protein
MERFTNKGGRPRQFPPCNRYGAHRFSPKTNRCPCGFQRTGTEPPKRRETVVVSGIRFDAEAYHALQALSEQTGKPIRELIRIAVVRLIQQPQS